MPQSLCGTILARFAGNSGAQDHIPADSAYPSLDMLLLSVFVIGLASAAGAPASWSSLAPGLEIAELVATPPSELGDSRITVVRVDPERFEFRLLSAKLLGLERNPTAKEWAERYHVTGVINASMYQTDQRTSVGFMKDGKGVNNKRWTKDNAIFAAGAKDSALPSVQILDRSCAPLANAEARYDILVQSIRMLDCHGQNTWAPQPRKWSTAAIGTDGAGRVLFIHCRSPYSTHDLVDILRGLPLDLRRLMYVEGGPEASLYVAVAGHAPIARVGSFETGFREWDDNKEFWPIPNVIAFVPRARP